MGDENVNTANAPQLQSGEKGKRATYNTVRSVASPNTKSTPAIGKSTPSDYEQEDSAEDDDDEDEDEDADEVDDEEMDEKADKDLDEAVAATETKNVISGVAEQQINSDKSGADCAVDTLPDSAIVDEIDVITSDLVHDDNIVDTTGKLANTDDNDNSESELKVPQNVSKPDYMESSEDEDEDDDTDQKDQAFSNEGEVGGSTIDSQKVSSASEKQPAQDPKTAESSEDEDEIAMEVDSANISKETAGKDVFSGASSVETVNTREETGDQSTSDEVQGSTRLEAEQDTQSRAESATGSVNNNLPEEANLVESDETANVMSMSPDAEFLEEAKTSSAEDKQNIVKKAEDMDIDEEKPRSEQEGSASETTQKKTDASGFFTDSDEDDDDHAELTNTEDKKRQHSTLDTNTDGGKDEETLDETIANEVMQGRSDDNSEVTRSGIIRSDKKSDGETSTSKLESHRRRSKHSPKSSKGATKTSTDGSDSEENNATEESEADGRTMDGEGETAAEPLSGKTTQPKKMFANDSALNKGIEEGLFGGSSSEDEPLPSVQQARVKVDSDQLARDHQRMIRTSGSLDMVANTAKGFGSLLERLRAKRETKQAQTPAASDVKLETQVPADGFRKPQPKHKSHLLSLFGKNGTSKSMSAIAEPVKTETLDVEAGEEIEILLMKAAKKKIPRARLQPKFSVPFNITSELVIASSNKDEAPTPEKKFDMGGKRRALKKHLLAMAAQSKNGMRNEDYMGDFQDEEEEEEEEEMDEEESDQDYEGEENGDSADEDAENDGDGSATETEEIDGEKAEEDDAEAAAKAKVTAKATEMEPQFDEDGGEIEEIDMDELSAKAAESKSVHKPTQDDSNAHNINTQNGSGSHSGEDMMGQFVDENGYFISQTQGPKNSFGGQQTTHKQSAHTNQNKFNRLPSGLFSQSLSMDMGGSSQGYSQQLKSSQSQKANTQTQTQALGSQLQLDDDSSQMNLSMAFGQSGKFPATAAAESGKPVSSSDKPTEPNTQGGIQPSAPKRTKRGGKTTQHFEPVPSQTRASLGDEFQLGSDSQLGLSMAFGQSGVARKDSDGSGPNADSTQDNSRSDADHLPEELMLDSQNDLNLSMAFGATQKPPQSGASNTDSQTPSIFDTTHNPFASIGQRGPILGNLSQKESGNTVIYDEDDEDDVLERAARGERMTFSHTLDTATKEEASQYFSDKSDDEEVQEEEDEGKPQMVRKVIQGVRDQQKLKEREEKRKKRHEKIMDDEVGVSDEDDFSSDEDENEDGNDDLKDMMNDEDIEAGDVAALKRKIQEDLIADNEKAIDEIKQNVIGGYKRKAGNDFEDESEAMLAAARRRANARGYMDYEENSMDMFDTAHLRRNQIEEDDIELIDKSADFAKARVDKLAYMHSVESQHSSFSFHGCESMKSSETRRILQCIKKAKSCQGPSKSRLNAEDSNSQFGMAKLQSKGSFLRKPANQDSNSNWSNGASKPKGTKKVAASKSRKARFVFANSVSAATPAETRLAPTAESMMPKSSAIRKLHGLSKKKLGKPAPLKKAGSRGGSLFNIISNSSFKTR